MKTWVESKLTPLLLAGIIFLATPYSSFASGSTLSDTVIHERNGKVMLLSDYRGRWVLIDYWATWCSDCLNEIPTLNRIASEARVVVVGLSDERIQPAAWAAFLAVHPLSYRVALVDRASLPRQIPPTAFLIEMRPISYLVRPDGSVARRFIGAVSPMELETVIAQSK